MAESKVHAVVEVPEPQNVTELMSFIEMVNYSKCIPNLSGGPVLGYGGGLSLWHPSPILKMSSIYTHTPLIPCSRFSITCWNIVGADATPNRSLMYAKGPMCVFVLVPSAVYMHM